MLPLRTLAERCKHYLKSNNHSGHGIHSPFVYTLVRRLIHPLPRAPLRHLCYNGIPPIHFTFLHQLLDFYSPAYTIYLSSSLTLWQDLLEKHPALLSLKNELPPLCPSTHQCLFIINKTDSKYYAVLDQLSLLRIDFYFYTLFFFNTDLRTSQHYSFWI